jgi:hypothetical protein
MSKKKSSNGKGSGGSAKGGMKQSFSKSTPMSRRPPRQPGR